VVAAVVPASHESVDLAGLRDAVEAAGLARTWAPRQLLILDELPLLPAGKVDRERLRQLAVDNP
jgi:O-succinylbenzoic acid--CoA ligase